MQEIADQLFDSDPERTARIAALHERLLGERADNKAYVKRHGLRVAALIGLAFILAIVAGATSATAWYLHYAAVVLLVTVALMLMVYGILWDLPRNPAETRTEIELLEQEPREFARAVDLTRSGQPYALFLRSFGAEADGLRDYDGHIDYLVSLEAGNRMQSQGLVGIPNLPEVFDFSGVWTLQDTLLRALARRLHTVLLGDRRLLDRHARTGQVFTEVTQIMFVSEVWWPTFKLLAQHARAIVVLVDAASSSLVNELLYLRSRNIGFLCVQKQGTWNETGECMITYQDYQSFDLAVFERKLDEMLRD